MVEATTASSFPPFPEARMEPAELRMAERMLEAAGCGTLTVVTLNTRSCRDRPLLIAKAPEKVALKTGAAGDSSVIITDSNLPPTGVMSTPCAAPPTDHPAPTKVITRTEGANTAGISRKFGVKVMLMVDEDCMALLINCRTGWPASMDRGGEIFTKDPESLVKTTF